MHHEDLSDVGSLNRIINQINPDEIYNLAAQSHVKYLFKYLSTHPMLMH